MLNIISLSVFSIDLIIHKSRLAPLEASYSACVGFRSKLAILKDLVFKCACNNQFVTQQVQIFCNGDFNICIIRAINLFPPIVVRMSHTTLIQHYRRDRWLYITLRDTYNYGTYMSTTVYTSPIMAQ